MNLEEQLKNLAELREEKLALIEQIDCSYKAWQSANAEILNKRITLLVDLEFAETQLRKVVLEEYNQTGNKNPAPGVSVKIFTRLDYDSQVALSWAITHGLALKLDTPVFDKIVKASPPDFVTLREEPAAQIASDLSKYLRE